MALRNYALTLPDTLRDDLGLTSAELTDSKAERLINAASAEMSRVAGGRRFDRGEDLVHDIEGYGTTTLVLPRAPVASVDSVEALSEVDQTVVHTYPASEYWIADADAGTLHRAGGWPWTATRGSGIRSEPVAGSEQRLLRVTYTAGWITPWQADASYPGGALGARDLPEDLEEACIAAAVALYHARGRDQGIESEKLGNASVKYRDPASGRGTFLPPDVAEVARAYWRPGR